MNPACNFFPFYAIQVDKNINIVYTEIISWRITKRRIAYFDVSYAVSIVHCICLWWPIWDLCQLSEWLKKIKNKIMELFVIKIYDYKICNFDWLVLYKLCFLKSKTKPNRQIFNAYLFLDTKRKRLFPFKYKSNFFQLIVNFYL